MKYIALLILFSCCLFSSCVLRSYQDYMYAVDNANPIRAYIKQNGMYYHGYPLELTPRRELNITFKQNTNFDYTNSWTDICLEISTKMPYKKVNINEISCVINGKKEILIKNKIINIPPMNIVIDDYSNPIKIDGNIFYMPQWIRVNNYWSRLIIDSIDTRDFIDRNLGEIQDMLLIQIYSFDDEQMVIEEWEYKIRCGDSRLELRPWVIPHG